MADFKWEMKLSPQNSTRRGQYTEGFVEWEIASMPGVIDALDDAALTIAMRAEANLGAHRHEGHSYIDVGTGPSDIDRYVYLNDERGTEAAWAIEVGTHRSEGIGALSKAAGLPMRPRKKRPKTKKRR